MPTAHNPVLRVLVVGEREEDFHVLSRAFRQARNLVAELEWARHDRAGAAALRRGGYDLAFLDYAPGAATRGEMLRETRAPGRFLPVILLTDDEAEIDEAAWPAGTVDCLAKATLDRGRLERAVRYALGQAEVRASANARHWLERRLLAVTDAEQQRIGADLHDGLGQHLTGLACLAAALRDRLAAHAAPEAAAQADTIARFASEAIAQSRALARGLCPVQLEHAGLGLALEEMAAHALTLHGVEARFTGPGAPPPCDRLAALHLYRIAQEAVHNAVRHGGARHIRITLTSRAHEHCLEIADDGRGFETAGHGSAPGGGLRLMGYRAAMIGGVFSADSQPGRGTRITCHFSTFAAPHENDRVGKDSCDAQACALAG